MFQHAQTYGPGRSRAGGCCALALAPAASAHPEECSTAAAWASGGETAFSPYTSFEAAEEGTCTSAAVQAAYDDSNAQLAAGETDADNLRLLASQPKAGTFAPESAFNSDIAFEDGFAYVGNYEGVSIYDVRRPSNPKLVTQIICPGS